MKAANKLTTSDECMPPTLDKLRRILDDQSLPDEKVQAFHDSLRPLAEVLVDVFLQNGTTPGGEGEISQEVPE
ncbi:MAG: hypothetical protein L6R30_26270 [Thermoanaerobaculia bacterium]|nr:hypothetical protein [Thermoanaerobaculia bacterium]